MGQKRTGCPKWVPAGTQPFTGAGAGAVPGRAGARTRYPGYPLEIRGRVRHAEGITVKPKPASPDLATPPETQRRESAGRPRDSSRSCGHRLLVAEFRILHPCLSSARRYRDDLSGTRPIPSRGQSRTCTAVRPLSGQTQYAGNQERQHPFSTASKAGKARPG